MTNNDFDFIKNKFDNDGVKAPDSISEDAVSQMLPSKAKLSFYKKASFKKAVSLVACFALLIGIMSFAMPLGIKDGNMDADNTNPYELKTFKSYKQFADAISDFKEISDIYKDEYVAGSAEGTDDLTLTFTEKSSHAETYKQVGGVDEGDIIKNNGKYMFYVNSNNEVMIYEGERLVSKITDYSFDRDVAKKFNSSRGFIEEIYVNKNHLIIVQTTDSENTKTVPGVKTNVHIYDISDITSPEKMKTFSQSGYCFSTRMIGSQLYIVSNISTYEYKESDDFRIYNEEDGAKSEIPATSIKYCDGSEVSDCVVVGTVDTEKMERTADTKVFLGRGSNIYCNEKNLYIALSNYDLENFSTGIIKAGLSPEKIEFTETAEISGYVDSQFSMDEKDGYLRVASTDINGNNLYVLDEKLNKVGEVTGLAKDESIKAARYIGDMCYLITFEETDPLFVIDASDPTNPVVKGNVEITGFSSQLHPVDENKLIGIGYSESFDIKLVLFDISNAYEPKVLDTYELNNGFCSNAQNNHKAIVVNNDKDYIAIDYSHYTEDETGFDSGALVFNVENDRINILNKKSIVGEEGKNIERLTYIDDTIYAFDNHGGIYFFDM